ncbi:class I SAM-dependent methyltransferase [Lysinibacillus sp. TE18511]
MFRKYPDDQCVRGVIRSFPNEKENENRMGLDIGCGAGRHSKLMLDMGFTVKAIDIIQQNVTDTSIGLKNYPTEKLQVECIDFLEMPDKEMYDLIIAWHCLYAYNNDPADCPNKICIIRDMLKTNGKIIMSLKSDDDSLLSSGSIRENGLIDNKIYNTPGYIFYSQSEMIDMITKCGFKIDYIEKFSRVHKIDRKNIITNEMWKNTELDVNENWYAVCATKI